MKMPSAMLEELETIPWKTFAQPSENGPSTVAEAIRQLAAVGSDDDASRAYNGFLFAIGNNHAGTYFPVVIPTLPFLEALVRDGSLLARNAALDVLIDLVGSFEPDRGHQTLTLESGESRPMRDVLRERVAAFEGLIMRYALDQSAQRSTRELAGELLDLLERPR